MHAILRGMNSPHIMHVISMLGEADMRTCRMDTLYKDIQHKEHPIQHSERKGIEVPRKHKILVLMLVQLHKSSILTT